MANIIITVDTEGHVGKDPIKHLIWGETKDGRECGISLIMDLCDNVGAKAVFFVDIAEAWHYGKEKIEKVLKYIDNRGHTVGVHIHPDHMADPQRLFLYEYSYNEQYEIIKKCTDLYISILGRKPECFRAGKYSANRDTLKILNELGYRADFSEFYGQKWCGINPPITGNNTVKISDKMIEIPVISYKSHFYKFINRYDKFDANSTLLEQKYIYDQIVDDNCIKNCVVFAHSFSFLKWRHNPDKPSINKRMVKKFRKILKYMSKKGVYKAIDSIIEQEYEDLQDTENKIIELDAWHSFLFFILKAWHVFQMRIQVMVRHYHCKQ